MINNFNEEWVEITGKDFSGIMISNMGRVWRMPYTDKAGKQRKGKMAGIKDGTFNILTDDGKVVHIDITDMVKEYFGSCDIDFSAEYKKQYYKENEEQIKERMMQYRKENAEQLKEYSKQYYNDNIEQINEREKQYYKENEEQIKEYRKQYYKENVEYKRERAKQYYKEHTEHIKEYYKQYYQKKKAERANA